MNHKKRFENKIIRLENGCWGWKGSKDAAGYGMFYFNGRLRYLHRYQWEQSYGSIPHGLLVCHACDNPPCANPQHLFLGTYKDNALDRVKKISTKTHGNQLRNMKNGDRCFLSKFDLINKMTKEQIKNYKKIEGKYGNKK